MESGWPSVSLGNLKLKTPNRGANTPPGPVVEWQTRQTQNLLRATARRRWGQVWTRVQIVEVVIRVVC